MGTEMAEWLRGIKTKVIQVVFARKQTSGEVFDKSVTPVTLAMVEAMNAAYAKADGPE